MQNLVIPNQIYILILVVIVSIVVILILMQWKKVRVSQNAVDMLQKEIEIKKINMVEKDLESKRLMNNPIPMPKEQQERLSDIRRNADNVKNSVGFLHNEINERLSLLEAQTEQKKLEKMLKEIEQKEKNLK